MKKTGHSATAFAPATVANVAVGFDILGFAVDSLGDRVTVVVEDEPGIRLQIFDSKIPLPTDPAKNTATAGLLELIKDRKLQNGFKVSIHKGIPIGSGLGGSAASAVGALVAANALLEQSLSKSELLKYALTGEYVASGSRHPDNVSPCLFGGLVLTQSVEPVKYVQIPVPAAIYCVLVHPHIVVETKTARGILAREIPLSEHVTQSRNLASFVSACYTGDIALLRSCLDDVIIERQRAQLIPEYYKAKTAARREGALGFSISGSGPTVFAWADSIHLAQNIEKAILKAFGEAKLECSSWIAPISTHGARLIV